MTQTASQQQDGTEYRAKVRMYRHGLGDCLLVTLRRAAGSDYRILIDCGVILGTKDASNLMTKVLSDVATETSSKVDLLVATHEHWDHLSGFVQAAPVFGRINVEQVWMAWTEDPSDQFGQQLVHERAQGLTALRLGAAKMLLSGDADSAETVGSLIELFGAAGGASTRDALEAVRKKVEPAKLRYCRPTEDPFEIPDTGARIYVLGPPRDLKQLKKTLPSKKAPETYGLAKADFDMAVNPLFGEDLDNTPFGSLHAIPVIVAQEMEFFKTTYWNHELWRRIDGIWLDGATELALQLDSATNNTSLVLAIELANGEVLLFAADAQVGNWESWQDLRWELPTGTITGPDLLKRTIFYKVGHHGSHNATLSKEGLELMEKLRVAAIPVDHAMAVKKRWGQMPLPALVDRLMERTQGALLRSDESAPAALTSSVKETALFFEVRF